MLHRILLCVVGLVFLLSLCNAELLVRKTLTNTEILSSRAVVVKINIFNTGKTSAYDVELFDQDWLKNFDVKVGIPTATWDKIAPGQNVSHYFVVQPKAGVANTVVRALPGYVQYRETAKGPLQARLSIPPSRIQFREALEGEVRSGSHLAHWGIFSFLSVASLLVPFGFWGFIQLNFEDGLKRKKLNKKSK
ncbi:transloconassociated protein subunit beta, putative [Acanthamoeba castellanii str. Neff]|uniref:Transloconassociated protein subunit beta, putative n=1 Tax=Acanthamoeba castellanii (strain ATCC 30010 / Neff) TaxID=1257118 RepID=L8GTT4_ACACF|nr:transloconassociated protein subunit beta, putative [Acanthamoeba castellanii str. Neff]ELR16574.1 transloconassociated protein subunit beta, putative [Acanthamoeba castellanii str. Neff]